MTDRDFTEAVQELQDDILRAAERASRNGLTDQFIALELHTLADQAVRTAATDATAGTASSCSKEA